jgi:fructose-bisphosphate aldolase class II
MIVSLSTLLTGARKASYAVGAFNVYNYETIRGVVEAGVEEKTPVIIAFGERYLENMSFTEVASLAASVTSKSEVPVSLHLDHCKSVDHIVQAIRAGFTSVMYDGSALPYDDNVATTREVTRVAHAVGVSVEAELGAISLGERSNEEGAEQIYTDPGQARDFVARTSIDALAVSIGTVHGMYKGEPKVDVGVLKEIHRIVPIPLVLHGGSGTPVSVLHDCIRHGICKVNVNTEISAYTVDGLRQMLADGKDYHFSRISREAVTFVKEVVRKYIGIFNGAA